MSEAEGRPRDKERREVEGRQREKDRSREAEGRQREKTREIKEKKISKTSPHTLVSVTLSGTPYLITTKVTYNRVL